MSVIGWVVIGIIGGNLVFFGALYLVDCIERKRKRKCSQRNM